MQAVILAAGKGARLKPLTHTIPKPLIAVNGKPLIMHALDALPACVDEILIVVNHLRDQIIDTLGSVWNNIPICYVIQEPLSGTAGALHLLKDRLHDRFLVLNADDLYHQEDLKRLTQEDQSILVYQTHRQLSSGAQTTQPHRFTGLGPGSMAVCGAYVLNTTFFDIHPVEIQVSIYREFGIPQTLALLAQTHEITAIEASSWYQVGTHEELKNIQQYN